MKKKILFVGNGSYKNLSDTFWRVEILKSDYDVTYLGFNEGLVNEPLGFRLVELEGFGNSIFSRFRLLFNYHKLVRRNSFDLIVVNYFIGVSFFYFVNINAIVDIRSSIIRSEKLKRIFYNFILKIECSFFKRIVVISESLRDFLNINPNNSIVFPLGAQKFDLSSKSYEDLSLLYIGTLNFRRIYDTIIGYNQFRIENPNVGLRYYIIGYGSPEEENRLRKMIVDFNREDEIFFLGELRYPEFIKYMNLCNVGVSYIPITDYFNCQPPTKTFEYLVNGLCVIGTATIENKKIINTNNGVLINDSPLSFKQGLEELVVRSKKMNSLNIIEESTRYTWYDIVIKHTMLLFQQ